MVARPGFITGIEKEAVILKKKPKISINDIKCAGASSDRAYNLSNQLINDGCNLLISFGIAGALDSKLKSGDLVIPKYVMDLYGNRYETATNSLLPPELKNLNGLEGALFGADQIISRAAEKLKIHQSTSAIAVDMETLGIAKSAIEHEIPFLVIRVICDTADQEIPNAAINAIDQEGKIKKRGVWSNVAKHPFELPQLLKLAVATNKALSTLRRVAALGFNF